MTRTIVAATLAFAATAAFAAPALASGGGKEQRTILSCANVGPTSTSSRATSSG